MRWIGQPLRFADNCIQRLAMAFVRPDGEPVSLLSRSVDRRSFCWRVDAVCPEQVLSAQTTVVQSGSQVLVAFNRKGPLSSLDQQGLSGAVAGSQLSVPLGMVPRPGDPCTLGQGSAIHATAATAGSAGADGGAAARSVAEALQGEITLIYAGQCFTLGGSGALYDDDRVELSMRFSATRR